MQIKRMLTLVVALVMAVSVAGCGSVANSDGAATEKEQEDLSDTSSEMEETTQVADMTVDTASMEDAAKDDILIVYFSAANMNDVDAVTSATPLIDGASSVEWMANIIHETVGGEIVKIIPSEDYPTSYDAVADVAKKEADNEVHPAFEPLNIDPTAYKTVFIGYPMWWYRMPMVLETFFDTYDFSGVTIIPFNTHEGSRDGGTYDMIRDREPQATVLEGLPIRGGNAGEDSAKKDIEEWLDGLSLE